MRIGNITALCLIGALMAMFGCSTAKPPTLTPTPLIPCSAAADVLVWLEDMCEVPEEDATTYTSLEAVADMFALPVIMAVYVARAVSYMTVGVALQYAGRDHQTIKEQIDWVLPMPFAGPSPDVVRYPVPHPFGPSEYEGMPQPHESCLF